MDRIGRVDRRLVRGEWQRAEEVVLERRRGRAMHKIVHVLVVEVPGKYFQGEMVGSRRATALVTCHKPLT